MTLPDLINGTFESGGAFAMALNVATLYRHKEVRGFHVGPTLFFTAWGGWNLWYYPSLGQWISFCGGVALFATSLLYTSLTLWYIRVRRKS